MADYDNRGTGVLFKNDRKEEGSKQPDYKGTMTLPDGTEMDLGAWLKTSKKGSKFMSLKLSEKYQKPSRSEPEWAEQPEDGFEPF